MKPILVAEVGNNHEGSLKNALELLALAKESGADMVKFQAGHAEGFARKIEDIKRYRKYELGRKGYDYLLDTGNKLNIPVFFSVWSSDFDDYKRLPYYKIAARQCQKNYIKKHDKAGLIVSIPYSHPFPKSLSIKYATILHCVSEYPALDPKLDRMLYLKKIFPHCPVGYSDHTIGLDAAKRAVDLGAEMIEKHFSFTHDWGELRDHEISMTPEECKELSNYIGKIK